MPAHREVSLMPTDYLLDEFPEFPHDINETLRQPVRRSGALQLSPSSLATRPSASFRFVMAAARR